MAQFELKDNSGTLFKNNRKEKDTHPEYTGTCMVDGKIMRMSAWIKEGKSGKFFSMAFNPPFIKDEDKSIQATGYIPADEDIPF